MYPQAEDFLSGFYRSAGIVVVHLLGSWSAFTAYGTKHINPVLKAVFDQS